MRHESRKLNKRNYLQTAHSDKRLLAGVNHTNGLVLAGGADKGSVAVPGHIVNDIRMHVLQVNHGLTGAHVPDDDLVVTTWGQMEVMVSWTGQQQQIHSRFLFKLIFSEF